IGSPATGSDDHDRQIRGYGSRNSARASMSDSSDNLLFHPSQALVYGHCLPLLPDAQHQNKGDWMQHTHDREDRKIRVRRHEMTHYVRRDDTANPAAYRHQTAG